MTTIPFLPESAPFSPEQRAWLNGFFAGLLGADAAVAQAGGAASHAATAEPEDFPWHDPALSLEERLGLADGRPPARRLMAAMAQLDCGQCGYLCQTYAEALAGGAESKLSLCVPGGKETSRALKRLMEQSGVAAAPAAAAPVPAAPLRALAPGRFVAEHRLNSEISEKDTRHVVFHLNGSRLSYEVGDSFGVQASNCPDLVKAIRGQLQASAELPVTCPDGVVRSLQDALVGFYDVARPSDAAIELLAACARSADEARNLRALAAGEAHVPLDPDLLDLLLTFPSARPSAPDLVRALDRLQPRLYSIASSPKAHPEEVHLTVGVVRYERNGRQRKGVASTFLAERALAGGDVPIFVQVAHGFRLPADTSRPIIMIGPGTGIAPFRAFLEERRAIGATGRNWLFFGDQRRDHDFLYRDELDAWQRDGHARLETAFSRDQGEKVYVQHRMRENAAELWAWLEQGAHLYVCGDAKRMARDVDQALHGIVTAQSGRSAAEAKAYVAALTRDGRYQRDVY